MLKDNNQETSREQTIRKLSDLFKDCLSLFKNFVGTFVDPTVISYSHRALEVLDQPLFEFDTELQIRGGIEYNSKIFFLFLNENMLWPLIRTVSLRRF